MEKKQVIVIEDEELVQQSLVEGLSHNGFEVYAFGSAEQAIRAEALHVADAIIMDIKLPGMDGWVATQHIRQDNKGIPVIMVTAFSDLNHRIQGFETGADDYIIKPFFMEELVARLKAVIKRYEMIPGSKRFYQVGDLDIDAKSKAVFRQKNPIKLSITEFNLLALLADGDGMPVSKEEIMKKYGKAAIE
ncbi:response regulator transcription factor [Paraflavitalea speifideaquila]|uniref:response regulator transcription factor n=1 Tax=Paraflavitalea speifideaquila TaxID=3076558 RepID=UPI0028EA507F|nr:response regulator transcription factor [Paraflavitalea speifideiaquila]